MPTEKAPPVRAGQMDNGEFARAIGASGFMFLLDWLTKR